MLHSRSPSLFKCILCVFLLFISNISSAYTERFTLNISNDSASLNLSLKKGHKIYWQKSGDMGMPTTIDFAGSTNLENYSLWWPSPDIDTTDGITSYTCSNDVIIPLELKPKVLNKPINLKINLNYVICADQCVPVKQVIEAEVAESKKNLSNLYTLLIAAFLGGIFLNFMPCILPILGLKLMATIKTQGNYRTAFTLTFLGIMTSFLGLAFTSILLKKSGQQFGIGLGFQQPEFIIFLCIIITVFISLSLDKIQAQLPAFLSNLGAPKTNKIGLQKINFHEFFESFTSGVLATLLSIPCTAPFLGSAVLVAVVGSHIESILIFVFIGLGFSMPYILLILFPSLINYLPKPGKWMENIKKIMAMLLIASLLWLLWLIYGQLGLRAATGLFLLLALLKFILEESKIRLKIFSIILVILCSLYLPQVAHKEDTEFEAYSTSIWIDFDRQKLQQFIEDKKVVIVDVTADWCFTCKYNKFITWERTKTLKLLSSTGIVAMKADATVHKKEIENYLKEHKVYGIPFTAVYGPQARTGLVMPTLVNYDDIEKAILKAR